MGMVEAMKTFKANPHQFGPGKIHYIDPADESKTWCGRPLSGIPGRMLESGKPTCLLCAERPERERQSEERKREYEAMRTAEDAERARQDREWWASYNAYLRTPEWANRRRLVFKRAGNVCEACLSRPASEVHHTTYEHVGNEPLWELRAVCHACHELITKLDREARQ